VAKIRDITIKAAFISWLKRQRPERVFERRNGGLCPLAAYSGCRVGFHVYRHPEHPLASLVGLPAWATQFVSAWDSYRSTRGTAKQALRVVGRIQA
jgi:hypothetical protein